MALFFDTTWFDRRLDEMGYTKAELATHLEMDAAQLEEIWKDQRELMTHQVKQIAEFLNVTAEEIVDRAGVSTPVPSLSAPAAGAASMDSLSLQIEELNGRLQKLERGVEDIKAMMLEKSPKT